MTFINPTYQGNSHILKPFFVRPVLSSSKEVCLNQSYSNNFDEYLRTPSINRHQSSNDCNSCICHNGKPKCSNIWCGLENCLSTVASSASAKCQGHEVCVPTLQETCLYGPCEPRGDCRALEPSRRVAPPKFPAKISCWPNQAELSEQCARVTIVLDGQRIAPKSSVEGLCLSFRTILGTRLVETNSELLATMLIVLCDLRGGANDTIEVTVVSKLFDWK